MCQQMIFEYSCEHTEPTDVFTFCHENLQKALPGTEGECPEGYLPYPLPIDVLCQRCEHDLGVAQTPPGSVENGELQFGLNQQEIAGPQQE